MNGTVSYPFTVESDWYQDEAEIKAFESIELFGTKLRALLQRSKGRDLFDLHVGLHQLSLDTDRLVACFEHYLTLEGHSISRAMAEQRMLQKLTRSLTEDIAPLLPAGVHFTEAHAIDAFNRVWALLISRIPGEAWKSSADAISELRSKKYPGLLP